MSLTPETDIDSPEGHKDLMPKIETFSQFSKHIQDTARADSSDVSSESILVDLAKQFWESAETRASEQTQIEAYQSAMSNGTVMDVVTIITDDRAFLVDSVIGQITALGLEIEALFHPIVTVTRSGNGKRSGKGGDIFTESMMMVVLPRLTASMRSRIKRELSITLADTRQAVEDYEHMRALMAQSRNDLRTKSGETDEGSLSEAIAFLDWLYEGKFVFLGARSYDFTKVYEDKNGRMEPEIVSGSNLGILRDTNLQVLRDASEPTQISAQGRVLFNEPDPVTIAKSNLQSRVHRRARMDYISVKHYDSDGQVNGETRFVGLFTADAYDLTAKDVPLLRRKVARVIQRSGLTPRTHAHKRLSHILLTYPRDELFQISEDDLLRISTGIVHVLDRPRTQIFVRRDPFDRFVSVLAYVPREHYSTKVRMRIGEHLRAAYGGRLSAFYPHYSDQPVARVHFIIGVEPFAHPEPDIEDLQTEIAALAAPWEAGIDRAAEASGEADIPAMAQKYAGGFSAAYQERFAAQTALLDICELDKLSNEQPIRVRAYRLDEDPVNVLRAKFYRKDTRLELSDIMPVFGNMALHVPQETGYKVTTDDRVFWVHDYEMRLDFDVEDTRSISEIFETAFIAVLSGHNDDDAFNRLILPQNAHWRDIAFIRTLARYRQQTGMDPSETVQIEALCAHPNITGLLLALKTARFDPELFDSHEARRDEADKIYGQIDKALEAVASLDYDRVLRRLADLMMQVLRTNFYQMVEAGGPHDHISIKIASRELAVLPAPKPYREIFVWSPRIEGVHLRFGPVARGGLRWSDRRDDYRTEVLGLVKAQQVKNAVIVPVGSKGGFFPKQLPAGGTRDEVQAEAIAAYTTFISGLLDVTDSYAGEGVRAPDNVVRWDESDPYLVVAADKGTATFSDIANGIADDYDFWLSDAFASGGSVGYDHKKMGITARGGWEAVKRHFRELGKDIQSEAFDVIGIGDMSGDVFGNGMLLSEHIRLRAAFNHLDIFIDPNPDTATSFKERQRMFVLPRSTWQDYNQALISKGGGVFSRSEKSIKLTDEMKAMTGLTQDEVTPNALIHALLKAKADLLWFGGIGTYVKAKSESDLQVGDKANDGIRVTGAELKVKVIGEGANLGVTQAGRIEFAQHGGAVNTDAIDNSAGVDSSDNEVNIKILLGGAIGSGALDGDKRNSLLESMTEDVGHLVLQHNYDQTAALSLAQLNASDDHNAYSRFMENLERGGRLDRQVEGLPDAAQMRARASNGKGLTRPELAVLLAYAKIKLFDDLIVTDIADDPYFDRVLKAYFPKAVSKFDTAMRDHRLRSEIICSRLANLIVDTAGPLFMMRVAEQTNARADEIARSFMVAYETLHVASLSSQIGALDNQVPAKAQYALQQEIVRVIMRVSGWMLRRNEDGAIDARVGRRSAALETLDKSWLKLLSPFDRRRAESRIKSFTKQGIPQALAEDVSLLRTTASGFDVIAFSTVSKWPLLDAARLYYDMGNRFKIDRLRDAALKTELKDHYDRLALRRITEDLYAVQGQLARAAASAHEGESSAPSKSILDPWIRASVPGAKAYDGAFSRLSTSGDWSLAKFAIANAQLQELILE